MYRDLLFVLLIGICPGLAAADPKTITVWTRASFDTVETDALRAATAAFNRAQRVYRADLIASNYQNYADWVQGVAATGTLPCLLEVDGPYVAEFAWRGYLQSLDKFVTPALRSDLLPSILAQGTYDGRLYSLGQFDSGLGLWANRHYLTAAGVRIPTVARPWTLEEFEAALDQLGRLRGVEYPLDLAVYTGTSEFYAYAYLPILAGFGGDFIDRAGTGMASGVMDGPRSVAALTRMQGWFTRGWARTAGRIDDFEKGKAALAWTGHWRYPRFHAALADDLMLLPLPDFGHGLKTGTGSWAWSMTSTCAEPAGAWAFLSHLMSVEEILRIANGNGALPARRSALARSRLYGAHGNLELFATQIRAGAGFPRPAIPGYGTISKAFGTAVSAITTGADVQVELTRAAGVIDSGLAARRGHPK